MSHNSPALELVPACSQYLTSFTSTTLPACGSSNHFHDNRVARALLLLSYVSFAGAKKPPCLRTYGACAASSHHALHDEADGAARDFVDVATRSGRGSSQVL